MLEVALVVTAVVILIAARWATRPRFTYVVGLDAGELNYGGYSLHVPSGVADMSDLRFGWSAVVAKHDRKTGTVTIEDIRTAAVRATRESTTRGEK